MKRLTFYLKNYKKEVILGPLFKLIEAIFELIIPLITASIIDVGIKNSDKIYIYKMGGLMLVLGIVGLACALICQYFAAKASQGFGAVLRNALFSHINTLSHTELDYLGTPSLITRITNDVEKLQLAAAMLIRLVVRAPFLVIGSTIMAIIIDLRLSLIFLFAALLISAALYFIMSRVVPLYHQIQKSLDKISLLVRENLNGARVIRAFFKKDKEETRFEAANEDMKKQVLAVGKISALLNPVTYIIVNSAIVFIIEFGGIRVFDGYLTQGEIVALVNYMTQIMLALVVVANLVVIFTRASASAQRINEIFDTRTSVIEKENEQLPIKDAPEIEFFDVSFSYKTSDKPILKNISFIVNKGETVGIIGSTGSGKSTLAGLIPRFYDINTGSIKINGLDIKAYPIKALRKKIGFVPQKTVLFAGTLRENMQWGKKDAADVEIKRALDIAEAQFVEKMPDGYDSLITQGGKNLSGGQRQRLTIARALVRNPEILILDDSFSALDFITDAALRKSLKNVSNMTVIIISQRASSVKNADKIIVLENGEAVGIGKHEELIISCPVYKEICFSADSQEDK